MPLVIAFTVVLLVLGGMLLLVIRKLGNSKHVLVGARTAVVRAQARAEAAADSADRVTGVAEQAMQQTGDALDVAKEIHKVSGQMDALLEHVGLDEEPPSSTGKHSRPDLRSIRYAGKQAERYIA